MSAILDVASGLLVGAGRQRHLPEHYEVRDLVIGGVATHKLSRLLSKGGVTSPLRAPFTEFAGRRAPASTSSRHAATARGTRWAPCSPPTRGCAATEPHRTPHASSKRSTSHAPSTSTRSTDQRQ